MSTVLTNLKSKFTEVVCKSRIAMFLTFLFTSGALFMTQTAFAANSEENIRGLLELVIRIIGVLIVVLGIFFLVLGIVHYAQANSEGDGPAKNKAIMQISSGAMLLIVSILLMSLAKTFVGFIVTSV